MAIYLEVMQRPLKLILGAGTDQMREDVLEVIDQNLSSVHIQLFCYGSDKCGGCRTGLGCKVRKQNLQGPLVNEELQLMEKTNKQTNPPKPQG